MEHTQFSSKVPDKRISLRRSTQYAPKGTSLDQFSDPQLPPSIANESDKGESRHESISQRRQSG